MMLSDKAAAYYDKNVGKYGRLLEEVKFILESAIRTKSIKTHAINERIKTLASYLDKIRRKQTAGVTVGDKDVVTDIAGLRVVCLLLSNVDRVVSIIREKFHVIEEQDKINTKDPTSFGYASYHFIVKIRKRYKGPRYDGLHGLLCEIQVRTIAMDAWAAISHYLDYKSDVSIPSHLRRDFYALSGLFYVADTHFEMFYKESGTSKKTARDTVKQKAQTEHIPINQDTLKAYLEKTYPDREMPPADDLSELVEELSKCDYRDIKKLHTALQRGNDAFSAYEKEKPPGTGAKRFGASGAVRIALELVDNNYWRLLRSIAELDVDDPNDYMLKFKKFVKPS